MTVIINVQDHGLSVQQAPSGVLAGVIGCASAGAVATPIRSRDLQTFVNAFAEGPLLEFIAFLLAFTGAEIVACRAATVAAGSTGTVVHTGAGSSVVSATGASLQARKIIQRFVTGGTIGVAGIIFDYSLDGGYTWVFGIALGTANTYLFPGTGVTAAYAAGTILALQTESIPCTEPETDASGYAACVTAIEATTNQPRLIAFDGAITGSTADGIGDDVAAMSAVFRYVHAYTNARDQAVAESVATWKASVKASYAISSANLSPAAGMCRIKSQLTRLNMRRPAMWPIFMRRLQIVPSESCAYVERGSLSGVTFGNTTDNPLDTGDYFDSRLDTELDDAKFGTLKTDVGSTPGAIYVKRVPIISDAGSDFDEDQMKAVMNIACETVYGVTRLYQAKSVRVNKATGFILEKEARSIESRVLSALNIALTDKFDISGAEVVCSRIDPILQTKKITLTHKIVPLGYANTIENTISFSAPNVIV